MRKSSPIALRWWRIEEEAFLTTKRDNRQKK
jgi:hypothetical protein